MHIIAEAASILCVAFYIKGKIPRWLGTLKFAAAAVYALLPQGGGAELIATAHDEFPVLSAADELGQFEAVFSHLKGGNGERKGISRYFSLSLKESGRHVKTA